MKTCFSGCVLLMLVIPGKNCCQNSFRPSCKEFNDIKAGPCLSLIAQCIQMPLQHVQNRSSNQSHSHSSCESSARLHLPLPSLPSLPMRLAPDMPAVFVQRSMINAGQRTTFQGCQQSSITSLARWRQGSKFQQDFTSTSTS